MGSDGSNAGMSVDLSFNLMIVIAHISLNDHFIITIHISKTVCFFIDFYRFEVIMF